MTKYNLFTRAEQHQNRKALITRLRHLPKSWDWNFRSTGHKTEDGRNGGCAFAVARHYNLYWSSSALGIEETAPDFTYTKIFGVSVTLADKFYGKSTKEVTPFEVARALSKAEYV